MIKKKKTFHQKIAMLIKSYITIISIVLIFVIIIALLFSKQITIYFFGDSQYFVFFLIGLVSFPILNINGVSFAILKSFKQIKYLARSELIVIIINILIFIPLVFLWRLMGAVIYITFAYITTLVVNHYYAQNIILRKINISLKDILKAKINKNVIKELFIFAGYGLTAGVALIFTDTVTRSIVVTKLGISQIGIYSPVFIWTSLFAGLIMPSIATYLYPRFCECKSDFELIGIMNDSLRFVTLLMIPFILLSIPIRFQLIPLFYSDKFKSSGNYLPWHFIGTLFYMWMYVFDQAMKPTGRIKMGGIIIIIMCILDFAVVYFLVPKIGLYGYMLKFLISPILVFVFYYLYWKNIIHFKLEMKNIGIMIYLISSFILLLSTEKYITSNYKINFLLGLSLTGLSFLMLNKSEKDFIINRLRKEVIIKTFNRIDK